MNNISQIGLSSLMAYESALNTTSQNIANSTTPYYCRKSVTFTEGLFGNGVNVGDVNRIYNVFASQNVAQANSQFAMTDTYLTQLKSFEPLLDQDSNSIGQYINDSLKSLQQLNADSSSIQGRNLFMNDLSNMVNQFGIVTSQIQSQLGSVNQSLQTYASEANTILKNIASLNGQVSSAPSSEDTSTLLDQREQQMQKLAKYFNFTSQVDAQGQLNLTFSNGLPLVSGQQAAQLSTIPDPENSSNLDLAVSSGTEIIPVNSFITSGQVAGMLNFRDTLEQANRAVGRLALGISQSFNAQNKLGIDYNGNLGDDIFNDINNTSSLGARAIANINSQGSENITVSINDINQLTTSDYQLQFDTSSHYILTRESDNSVVSSGSAATIPFSVSADGFTLNVNSGSITAGDQFTISPTANAVANLGLAFSDPKLFALGLPVVVSPNIQNSGDGVVQLTSVTDTTNSSFSSPNTLSPPITIKFLSLTSYQLVNANTNAVIEGPITYNPDNGANVFPTPGSYDPGYRISLSGDIVAGDTFNINYNTNGSNDNRNGLNFANLYQQANLENGTLTFQQDYRFLSNDVSIQTNSANIQYQSAQALQEQAKNNYDEISAVSLEEETINLANYQQAYQASAQVLQAAKTVFEAVMGMLRG